MIFTEITQEELRQYQTNNEHRYFFSQCNFYKKLADKNNIKAVILAVKENDNILAYGIFLYYRYKKFFYKVTTQFGPVMDYNNNELVEFYFTKVKEFFSKDYRVLSIVVNPFTNEKIFNDINEQELTDIGQIVHSSLSNLGYKNLNSDFYTNPTLASRCVYSKDLSEIEKTTILKNISNKARSSINKTINDNIKTRDLNLEDNKDFEIFSYLNEITTDRLDVKLPSPKYFLQLQQNIGDKLHIKLAYLEYKNFIKDNKQKLDSYNSEKNSLLASLEDPNTNQKRTKNKISELEKNIISIEKKIEKVSDYKDEYISLSCSVFIESGKDLIYFLGMTNKDLNVFEGPYAIIYNMMNYAIDNNFKYFNFYGTSQNFTKTSVDFNVLQFKRSFNGNIEWFMDNYELRNKIGKIWKV